MSTQDFHSPGRIREALEADLSAWGATSGVLAQLAREIASCLDSGVCDVTAFSRELRLLVKQLRDGVPEGKSELEAFLESVAAEGFDRG